MKERPVYRQPLIPWYDSTLVCRVLFWLLVPVFIFALLGFFEAIYMPDWQVHLWMPLVLGILSFWVILTMGLRLRRRRKIDEEWE